MGEKGNVTSEELAAAASGGLLSSTTTQVTAVLGDAGDALKDRIVDKGIDAAIETGAERVRRRPDGSPGHGSSDES